MPKRIKDIPTLIIMSKGEKNSTGWVQQGQSFQKNPGGGEHQLRLVLTFPLFTPVYTSQVGDEPHFFQQYHRSIQPLKKKTSATKVFVVHNNRFQPHPTCIGCGSHTFPDGVRGGCRVFRDFQEFRLAKLRV